MLSPESREELRKHPLLGSIIRHPNFSPQTQRSYLCAVRDFLVYAGDDPQNWTYAIAEDWRDKLLERGLERDPIADKGKHKCHKLQRQSVQVYLKGLKFASRKYAERHSTRDNPIDDFAARVEVPNLKEDVSEGETERTKRKRRAIQESAAAAMLATCDESPVGVRDRAILVLGFRTGMRRAGMAGIKLGDFGIDRVTGEPIVWITLKGGRRHDVPLDARCVAALDAWRAVLNKTSGPLWYAFTRDGRVTTDPLTAEGIYEAVQKHAKLAGVPKVSPHVMRHSFISYMVAHDVPVYRIKRITGQKTDSIIDHYTTDLDGTPASSVLPDDIG